MSITVNSSIVAEARIQGVVIRPVVGSYELHFVLDVVISPQQQYSHRVSIIGAGVTLMTGGNAQPVGFARPESSFEIRQGQYQSRMTQALIVPLQPGQVVAIERLRDCGDVAFELLVTGVGTTQNGDQHIQDRWRIDIPRSDWLQKLRNAKARDILLLEVPLPLVDRSKEWTAISKDLQGAEVCFRDGDHRGCVALCRVVLDELGHQKFGKQDWSGPLLDRLGKDRTGMTASEREAALWAAARHYAHLAHHGTSDGGVSHYSRAEAHLVLMLVASLVGHAQSA
jgi:hypothetical protein